YEAATGMDRREFPKLPEALRTWPDARLLFELNEIVLTACTNESRARYACADAMLADLQRLGRGQSIKRHRIWQRRARSVWKSSRAAAVIVLAGAGVVMLRENFAWRSTSRGTSNASAVASDAYRSGYSALRQGTPKNFNQ